jgi:hypothetical protein
MASTSSNQLTVEFICPTSNVLAQYDKSIIGDGTETVYTSPTQISHPTFIYALQTQDVIPADLNYYQNHGAAYSSSSGMVSCHFTSSNSTYTPLDLSYTMMNGKGGLVKSVTNNSIIIVLPVGLTK